MKKMRTPWIFLNLNCARANEIAYLKFPVCGRSTQASIYTHARAQ